MYETCIKIRGFWDVKLHGPDGKLKDHRSGENVITTNGKESLARYLLSAATVATNTYRYIAIGTGGTAESASDTAMSVEVARASGSVTYTSGAIYEVTATFAAGTGTGTIVEYGLFNSSANGVMLSRDTESAIAKGAGDTLTVTTQVTLS